MNRLSRVNGVVVVDMGRLISAGTYYCTAWKCAVLLELGLHNGLVACFKIGPPILEKIINIGHPVPIILDVSK